MCIGIRQNQFLFQIYNRLLKWMMPPVSIGMEWSVDSLRFFFPVRLWSGLLKVSWKHSCGRGHFVLGCLCLWHHEQDWCVGDKCLIFLPWVFVGKEWKQHGFAFSPRNSNWNRINASTVSASVAQPCKAPQLQIIAVDVWLLWVSAARFESIQTFMQVCFCHD